MKVIIQIPCFNEEQTLPTALAALPRSLPGISKVEWLIVDDGSKDRTVEVALGHGVDHVVRLPGHKGLAKAFMAGIEACILEGADIIVHTDADNQYCAEDIPLLIEPILRGSAEMVVGARSISNVGRVLENKKVPAWPWQLGRSTRQPDANSR